MASDDSAVHSITRLPVRDVLLTAVAVLVFTSLLLIVSGAPASGLTPTTSQNGPTSELFGTPEATRFRRQRLDTDGVPVAATVIGN